MASFVLCIMPKSFMLIRTEWPYVDTAGGMSVTVNMIANERIPPDHMLKNLPATLMIICEYDDFCSEDLKLPICS